MVVGNVRSNHTDQLLFALSDHTRRDILRRSMLAEHSVSSLATNYDMSFAAVQKHVAVLQRADLIRKRKQGRQQLVTSNIDAVRAASEALDELEQIWRGRIGRIGILLADDGPPSSSDPAPTTTRSYP